MGSLFLLLYPVFLLLYLWAECIQQYEALQTKVIKKPECLALTKPRCNRPGCTLTIARRHGAVANTKLVYFSLDNMTTAPARFPSQSSVLEVIVG